MFCLVIMDAIAFCLIVSSVILYLHFVRAKRSKPLNLPPGPPKLPLVGNIHQLAGALPHRAFRDLARKHGPIMHVQLGQLSMVVVSSPRLAKQVFRTHDIALADRPKAIAVEIVLPASLGVALAPYGEYWRQVKKICTTELLGAHKVRSFGAVREQEVRRFVEFVRASCGWPVNLYEKATEMVNNIICKSTFGKNSRQQDLLIEFMEEIAKEIGGFNVFDLFPGFEFLYVVCGMRSKSKKLRKNLDKIFDDLFEENKGRRREGDGHHENLFEVLLRIKEEGDLGFPITDDHIKSVLVDMFSAGTDTTAITIEWAMAELMRNPRVMEAAQAEVREAFKGKATIAEADLQGLSYLQAVIKETLRLHPPLPLLLPRECREACKIDGYDIPVKQKVIINAWACATDPEYWEDAQSFKPERFYKTSVDFMGTDYEFIPFGAGRRMCPGIAFGLISIQYSLAQMLCYFNWRLPHGLNPLDIDMTEGEGILAAKKLHLHLIPSLYS